MSAPNGLEPHLIEDVSVAEQLRRVDADGRVNDQNLRALDRLVGRAGRRQPEPAGVLLFLFGRDAVAVDRAQVLEPERDRPDYACSFRSRALHDDKLVNPGSRKNTNQANMRSPAALGRELATLRFCVFEAF